MKKTIACLMLVVTFFSCKTEETIPTPDGYVPSQAKGQWLYGTFSMTDFWGYDGSYIGNPFELSVAFNFMGNGEYEQYFMSQAIDYSTCRTEAFSYVKGTVIFDEANKSFTVYPAEGNFRGFYSCIPSSNFDRAAAPSELKIQTFYYEYETDTNGKNWMIIKFDPNDEYGSYFASTTW